MGGWRIALNIVGAVIIVFFGSCAVCVHLAHKATDEAAAAPAEQDTKVVEAPPPEPPSGFSGTMSVATFEKGDVLDRCSDFTVTPPKDAPPGWTWSPTEPGVGETSVPLQKPCKQQFQNRPVLATCVLPAAQYPDRDADVPRGAHVRPVDRGITLAVVRHYFNLSTLASNDRYMRVCMDGGGDWQAVDKDSDGYREAVRARARREVESIVKKAEKMQENLGQ